ncbi:hypothetical protein JXQ70_09745 [bacterium]|nr:hypothetical protein [bacterium]
MFWRTKWFRIPVIILCFCYGIYFVAINIFLNTAHVQERLNPNPAKRKLGYQTVYSFFPFQFTLQDVTYVHSAKTAYRISADKLSFWLKPCALLNHEIYLSHCSVSGLEYEATSPKFARTKKPDTTLQMSGNPRGTGEVHQTKSSRDGDLPKKTIEAETRTWQDLPRSVKVPTRQKTSPSGLKKEGQDLPKAKKKDWDFSLPDVQLVDLRKITYDNFQLETRGQGSITLKREGDLLSIPESHLFLEQSTIREMTTKNIVFEQMKLDLNCVLKPIRYKQIKGKERLHFLQAELDLHESLCPDLSFLEIYLKKADSVAIKGGRGSVKGSLSIQDGSFVPGSSLTYASQELEVSSLTDYFRGKGTVKWDITRDNSQTGWHVKVRFSHFELIREQKKHIYGTDNEVHLWGPETSITEPIQDFKASLTINQASLPDLSHYNTYFPDNTDLIIQKGLGTLTSKILLDDKNTLKQGQITLQTSQNEFLFQDMTLLGDMLLTARLGRSSLDDYQIELQPTTLELKNIRILHEHECVSKDWWGSFSVNKGLISPRAQQTLEADFTIKTRDLWPVLYLYLSIKDVLPDYLARSLKIPLTQGYGHICLAKDRTEFDLFHLEGKKLSLDARFRSQNKKIDAAVLLIYELNAKNKMKLGIELKDKKQKLIFEKAREWFKNYSFPARTKSASPDR